MTSDYLIYIGRFQPLHQGHLRTIGQALELAAKLIIIVGSARQSRSYENPWSFAEREQLIRACLPAEWHDWQPARWRGFVLRLLPAVAPCE